MRVRTRLAFVVLIGCVVMLGTAFTVVASDDLFGSSLSDKTANPTIIIDQPTMHNLPVLTDEEKDRMKSLTLGDARVQELLADHQYVIRDYGLWTGENLSLEGGSVNLVFREPTNVRGEWLSFSWLGCETKPLLPPVLVPYRTEYSGVTELSVFVNLSTNSIDQIVPRSDEGFDVVGDLEFTGEYDDIKTCHTD